MMFGKSELRELPAAENTKLNPEGESVMPSLTLSEDSTGPPCPEQKDFIARRERLDGLASEL